MPWNMVHYFLQSIAIWGDIAVSIQVPMSMSEQMVEGLWIA